nr:DLW-39 family protein [Natronoglycomyces albus]
MWKKLFVAAGVATVAVVVAKKVKAVNDERALWHEATTSAEDVRLRLDDRVATGPSTSGLAGSPPETQTCVTDITRHWVSSLTFVLGEDTGAS